MGKVSLFLIIEVLGLFSLSSCRLLQNEVLKKIKVYSLRSNAQRYYVNTEKASFIFYKKDILEELEEYSKNKENTEYMNFSKMLISSLKESKVDSTIYQVNHSFDERPKNLEKCTVTPKYCEEEKVWLAIFLVGYELIKEGKVTVRCGKKNALENCIYLKNINNFTSDFKYAVYCEDKKTRLMDIY